MFTDSLLYCFQTPAKPCNARRHPLNFLQFRTYSRFWSVEGVGGKTQKTNQPAGPKAKAEPPKPTKPEPRDLGPPLNPQA